MFNPFKSYFAPRFLVGLEIKSGYMGAVQIFNSLKGPEVERIGIEEIKTPQHIHEELKAFFRTKNLKTKLLITSIATSQAVVREIPPSIDNPRKLHKIIKYQMEPYLPSPIEDVVVDFLPPEPQGNIMTIGVEKKRLSEHLESMSQADLEPDVVSMEDLALFFLYIHLHAGKTHQPVSIIHVEVEKKVVLIIFMTGWTLYVYYRGGRMILKRLRIPSNSIN